MSKKVKKRFFYYFLTLILLFSCAVSELRFNDPESNNNLVALGQDKRVDLKWGKRYEEDLSIFKGYNIYRSTSLTGPFTDKRNSGPVKLNVFSDWTGVNNQKYYYKLKVDTNYLEYDVFDVVCATTFDMSDDDETFLTSIQKAAFNYFYEGGHPVSGLARDRYPFTGNSYDLCASGGTGMGIMAIIVGIERGFINREDGAERILKILSFLKNNCQRYHGAWAHYINGETGVANEERGDIVETAFVIVGALTALQYFKETNSVENKICDIAKQLWEDIEWGWYKNAQYTLNWSWSKDNTFDSIHPIKGFDETMIVYLLGIASPTHSISYDCYSKGWARGDDGDYSDFVNNDEYFGIKQVLIPSGTPAQGMRLFWTQYSYLGFDPRGKNDGIINTIITDVTFAEVFKNISLIDQAYCATQPFPYYSSLVWGLTPSDDPSGYLEHSPHQDNGTISPTAALSAIVYTPNESIATLKYFYNTYGENLWDIFGFKDAFNIDEDPDWYAPSYIAIDQGPIIIMIENYRTQLLWKYFMSYKDIQNLLTILKGNGWTINDIVY